MVATLPVLPMMLNLAFCITKIEIEKNTLYE